MKYLKRKSVLSGRTLNYLDTTHGRHLKREYLLLSFILLFYTPLAVNRVYGQSVGGKSPSGSERNTVTRNILSNQMQFQKHDGTTLYYDTEDISSVNMNQPDSIIVHLKDGNSDVYQNDVLKISFSKAQEPEFTSIDYDYNIIIGYGQSLAAGNGFVPEDLPLDEQAKMFFLRYTSTSSSILKKNLSNVACKGDNTTTQDCPPNASATISFAKQYRAYTNDDERVFVHICPAQGSMTIAQLMDFERYKNTDTNEFYFPNLNTGYATIRPYYALKRMLGRIKQLADAEGKTVGVIAVNWNQGEADYGNQSGTPSTTSTDYGCNGSSTEYKNRLKALHDDIWEDIQSILGQTRPPIWFVAQCSGQFVKSGFGINQALIDICDGKEFFPTHSTYPVPNKSDGHPTGNGYRWYGEYLAKSMADVLLRHQFPHLLYVKHIKAETDAIRIHCSVPYPPLRIETEILAEMKNFGFNLFNENNKAISIKDISIDDDIITIKPSTQLVAGSTVKIEYGTYYARGKQTTSIRAAGNICDSDPCSAFFTCMDDVTSSVEYVPLLPNGNGESLQGHPYPLYNFLLPFSTKVTIE